MRDATARLVKPHARDMEIFDLHLEDEEPWLALCNWVFPELLVLRAVVNMGPTLVLYRMSPDGKRVLCVYEHLDEESTMWLALMDTSNLRDVRILWSVNTGRTTPSYGYGEFSFAAGDGVAVIQRQHGCFAVLWASALRFAFISAVVGHSRTTNTVFTPPCPNPRFDMTTSAPFDIVYPEVQGRVELAPSDVETMKLLGLGSSTAPLFVGSFDPASGVVRFGNNGVASFWMEWRVTPEGLRAMADAMAKAAGDEVEEDCDSCSE